MGYKNSGSISLIENLKRVDQSRSRIRKAAKAMNIPRAVIECSIEEIKEGYEWIIENF
jgi:hypothetical protein